MARNPAPQRPTWSLMASVAAVGGVWLILQAPLSFLCTEPVGLEWILEGGRSAPDLASPVVLPFLVILLVGATGRLWETHPGAIRYFRSFPRCLAFYVLASVAAAVLEQVFDFHFVPSIGIYCAAATLLLAACFGGVRRPFRHLRLHQSGARLANVTAVVLAFLAYVEFCFDAQLWDLDLERFSATQWWLLQAVFTATYLLLAWAMLHSSLVPWLGRLIGYLASAERREAGSPFRLLGIHGAAAGIVLVAIVLLGEWAAHLWRQDAWIFPRGAGNQVFLGVDWYFVSASESLAAAEVMVFFWLAMAATHRNHLRAGLRHGADPGRGTGALLGVLSPRDVKVEIRIGEVSVDSGELQAHRRF